MVCTLPATPAAKLMPNVLLRSPLDNIDEAERGILVFLGNPVSPYCMPWRVPWKGHFGACCLAVYTIIRSRSRNTGEDTSVLAVLPFTTTYAAEAETTRDATVTSYKSMKIGVRLGATGCIRRWEGPSKSHWSATAHLKLGSPRLIRC